MERGRERESERQREEIESHTRNYLIKTKFLISEQTPRSLCENTTMINKNLHIEKRKKTY